MEAKYTTPICFHPSFHISPPGVDGVGGGVDGDVLHNHIVGVADVLQHGGSQ